MIHLGFCSETAKPPKNPVLVSTGDPDQITPPQISMRLVPAILISFRRLEKAQQENKRRKHSRNIACGVWRQHPSKPLTFLHWGFDDNHFNPSLYSVSRERELTATSFIGTKSYHSDIHQIFSDSGCLYQRFKCLSRCPCSIRSLSFKQKSDHSINHQL